MRAVRSALLPRFPEDVVEPNLTMHFSMKIVESDNMPNRSQNAALEEAKEASPTIKPKIYLGDLCQDRSMSGDVKTR